MNYVKLKPFGRRVPEALLEDLERKKLAHLHTTFIALRERLRDAREPVSLPLLKRYALVRSLLNQHGIAA